MAAAQRVNLSAAEMAELIPSPGGTILRNSISNLHAEGDTLWVGPLLNVTTDGGATWLIADADSLLNGRNRVFSIDVEGPVVWAGLGYTSQTLDGDFPSAGGFLVSHDGGETFTYRFPQLDVSNDSLISYGVSVLPALPVTVPEQSPPYDIDYDPRTGTVWVAGWASGLRKSTNDGRTWQRVVLPPDDRTSISPDSLNLFYYAPRRGELGNYNHTAFSVLIDEEGTVWAGTPVGVNRSTDGGRSWTRFEADGTNQGLVGNWVTAIEEQPMPGRNPVWMATWNSGDGGNTYNGITVTRDGGETFQQVLTGETVIDFAFSDDGIVYAAGREAGLFISDDAGASWRTVVDFGITGVPGGDRLDVTAVATVARPDAPDVLWVGTSGGLYKSTDEGQSWQVFRALVPTHPEEPTFDAPDVETFAYPNPFSPAADRVVGIRYDLDQAASVEIRIFDFAMTPVRNLLNEERSAGPLDVLWDGTDDNGLRVANGVYFFAVREGSRTAWGKILVIE